MTSKLTRDIIQSEIADFFAGVVEIHTELGGPNSVEEAQNQLTERVLACVPAVDSEPVKWINGCNKSVPAALRYLAENPRPIGGESSFNTAHLYQLAREIESMSSVSLYLHAQQPVVHDELLREYIRLVGCMISDYRERNFGDAQRWIRHIAKASDDFEQKHGLSPWEMVRKSCRAAMLQAGTLTNEDTKQAWTGIPDIDNAINMLDRIDTLESCDDDRVEAVKTVLRRLAGNSPVIPDGKSVTASTGIPVIPDGYVMVSVDLLSELRDWAHPEIEKYCEMWKGRRDSEFPALRKVIADADAMLAAAPQPQNEPQNIPEIIPQWIPVSERMPEKNGTYQVWNGKHVGAVPFLFGSFQCLNPEQVTHWMPTAKPPREVK